MASNSPSVLLIEDDEDIRKMLELLLEEWGYLSVMAGTATEGFRCLLERSFDLIILDNWLPDLDGIELCRQIREFDQQTPIIFYSAAEMGNEDREALSKGANAYVYKSGRLGALREALTEALNKRS